MPTVSHRPAFTLVEVMIAMFVLVLIGAGTLAATWRMSKFAREETEELVASALCEDVAWAIFRNGKRFAALQELSDDEHPHLTVRGVTVRPLRRVYSGVNAYPKPRLSVAGSVAEDNLSISVSWGPGAARKTYTFNPRAN